MTIFFPDVSNYQAGLSLNGAVAVIAKGTEGTDLTDQSYANFRAQARQLGIPFAGYHWVNETDINQQAAHAYSVLGSTPAMWDAEAAGSTVPRLVQLTSAFRGLGGNPRLVYLPHWWWQQLGSPDLTPLAQAGLSLVSSDYTGYSDTGPGWAPYGGMTPQIWQYTDAQPLNGQSVDFNAYKGTVDELRALLGITPATPPLQEENMPYLVIIDPTIPGHADAQWQMSDGVTSRQFPSDIKYRSALPSAPRTFITTANGTVPSWASGATVYRLADGEDPVAVQAGLCGPAEGSGSGGVPVAHTHDVGPTGPAVPE